MHDMSSFFEWLFKGNGSFITFYTGQTLPITCLPASIVLSSERVQRSIAEMECAEMSGSSGACVQMFAYTDSEQSVVEHFSGERMGSAVVGTVLISERFLGCSRPGGSSVSLAGRECMRGTKSVMMRYFQSYGTSVVCHVRYLAMKNYLAGHRENFVLRSAFLREVPRHVCYGKTGSLRRGVRHGAFPCTKEQISTSRVIGQFNNEFILVQHRDSIFAIDQHAIHERIRLEVLLEHAGRDVDIEMMKEKACKGAIKFGERLCMLKMRDMVRWYGRLRHPFVCCHGRPTVVYIGCYGCK